jgi:hypothetical protein
MYRLTQGFVLAALVAVPLVGCVDPGEPDAAAPDPDQVTGVSYDFATGWSYSLKITGSNGPGVYDMGPTAGRVCYLAGVSGQMANDGAWSVGVYTSGANYQLRISTVVPAKAWARCVSGTGTAQVTLYGDSPAGGVLAGAMQTGRRCFLTSLYDTTDTDFTHTADNVEIYNDDVNWYLRRTGAGSLATARCVNGTADVFGIGTTAPANGSVATPIENVAGSTCGLQQLKGKLTGTTDDGVWISREDSGEFVANATNGKFIAAGCIK